MNDSTDNLEGPNKEEIIESLEPLFRKAEEEGLWFYSKYQDLWFPPSQLRSEQARGKFIWGPKNWELRDPRERLHELRRRIDKIQEDYNELVRLIRKHY